jgi:Na+-translocating ferredoxin:NAD+ oxidoreductase RnfD subunit
MMPFRMTARTLTIGRASYPVVLPNIRDPRLHVAAVVLTVHTLGQVGLHFWVSVPQILAAIGTCFILEVGITFRQTRQLVWPASAMLTGSAVALIMRVVGTQPDDHWTFYAVEVFAVVAGLSLLTKYVIRYRGSHIFNPANVGLVTAFLVLGTSRVEPLDFWWAPLNLPMLAAYAVIIAGGLLITRRLHLLLLAATFWITFSLGLGTLAASSHCITTRWSFEPVCGFDFWRVIVTSPEVLIFLFFMITDPKTVPAGRVARVVFGGLVAIVSVLLMAPQTDEFGSKVALLSGLVVVCAARPILERFLPAPKSEEDRLGAFAGRLANLGRPAGAARGEAGASTRTGGVRRVVATGVAAVAVLAVGTGIVNAGAPAREPVAFGSAEVLNRVPIQVDPSTLPPVTVGEDVITYDHQLAGAEMQAIVVTLAQNLELENQALLRRDPAILQAVAHGDRLVEMQARLAAAAASGTTEIVHYRFDSIAVSLLVPFGVQTGPSLAMAGAGTAVHETYDAAGALLSRVSKPFSDVFAVRRATGDRWLTVAMNPETEPPAA